MVKHKKNIGSVRKTRLSLHPLSTSIRMLLTGSIVMGGMSMSTYASAALPLPKPPGAWATAHSALPRVSSASWSRINDKLWRSGTTEAQYGDKTLTVKQKDGRVILSWDSFDIDVSHLVQFKQPGSHSIALNRISNQAPPSRILGTLKANGQIYLINNNGFLFGANSVVDVNSLVVSTLNISDDVFKRGITKVFTSDGSAAFAGNGDVYLRNPQSGDYIRDARGNRFKISIHVDKGAQISTDHYGRVIMVAPKITNKGSITSLDGQVILAAATDKVYLQETGSGDTIRGLKVALKTGGEVTNQGNIVTDRGNVTLMGFAVNQQGLLSATTSVRVNGSIILRAGEKGGVDATRTDKTVLLPASSTIRTNEMDDGLGKVATVTLGEGSVTRVLPETSDKSTAVKEQKQPVSSIEIQGKIVHFESASAVIAPSGEVDITATETPASPGPRAIMMKNDSAIIMDPGSLVDVAGLRAVEKTMESNVIDVELRANVLADAPVQRNKNSFLYGKKIRVDIRKGTPLANIQPALDGIKATIAERSVKGGTVNFTSQGAVVLKKGSEVNISGGTLHYKAGYINTTQLLGEDRKIYDISRARADLRYTNILGQVSKEYKKWGVTKTWKVAGPFAKGRFESAYTEGQKAGTFTIKAQRLLQDGDIVAKTVNGRRQRLVGERAVGGSLNVNLAFLSNKYQTLVFQNNKDLNNPDLDRLKPARNKNLVNADSLIIDADSFRRNGLQNVTYTSNGHILLPKNLDMTLSDGGSFSLTGEGYNGIDMNGRITGHGTNVSMKTTQKDQNVVLGENARIDTSGRWVNDSLAAKPAPDFEGIFIDAGKVDVTSRTGSVIMNKGSLIRVNGGAWLTSEGELKKGKGGDVALAASTDPKGNGTLILEGRFEGFSFADSGTLGLSANEFRFAATIPDNRGETPSTPDPVYIPETLVEKSGFSTYNFTSTRNGITFERGVLLKPSQENLVLNNRDVVSSTSARDVSSVSSRQRLADEIWQPVNLGFTFKDPSPASNLQQTKAIYMRPGSRIQTEAGAEVRFNASSSIYINGIVQAPGGGIELNITKPAGTDPGYIPAQKIWLGAGSVLSAAGVFVPTHSTIPGVRQGHLFAGGKVGLNAMRGFIVMDKGALIDVSGASTILDQPDITYQGPGERWQKTSRASDAGEISLAAAEGIFPEGKILGWANTRLGAEGGRLKIGTASRGETNINLPSGAHPFIETPRKIMFSQKRPQSLKMIRQQGAAMADEANGYTWLDSGLLNHSGFDSIDLEAGNIVFTGDSSIIAQREVRLGASVISWQRASAGDTGLAAILSSYVALGSDGAGTATDAIKGEGQLEVEANMIDLLGGVSLQGFDQVQLNSNTDIRLRGRQHLRYVKGLAGRSKSLSTPGQWSSRGQLELNADRVYPASLSDYSIYADQVVIAKHPRSRDDLRARFGSDAGTIIDNISRSHPAEPLLSAGGRLAIRADTIIQAGELRAPLGEISLKAASRLTLMTGSLTSTSAQGQVIPFGQTVQNGLDWQYHFTKGDTLRVTRPPEKRILLSSDDVRLNKGAVIDMNGGGDLQAWEFIKGPGGSHDVFDSSGTAFAVLPGLSRYAPYDPAESKAAAGLKPGDRVYLSGIGDLPAGEYARLPARYALLDGAYLVTPLNGYAGITPGETSQLTDRTQVVAGQYRVTGTGIHDQDWKGFKIETRQQARLHSEIVLTHANRFYRQRARANESLVPFLPQDAGQLGITALSRLDLAGELRNQAEGRGRGGRLDIEATNLAVVSQRSASGVNSDRVELVANELNQLNMESLLLGGIRKQTDAGTGMTVDTRTLTLETNTGKTDDTLNLNGTEILLAAQDSIDLKRGVTVKADGNGGLGADTLIVKGDGALIRVSAGAQVNMSRIVSKGDKGAINLDKGARLAASSAMLLDASHETNINGKLEIDRGSLNLGAGRINLGDAPISATGLLLNRDLLDSLNLRELVMTSRKGIYAYGNVNFNNFDSIVFDGPGIVSRGNGSNHFTVQTDKLRFTHSSTDKPKEQWVSSSQDIFTVKAREIELGKGDYTLAGFNTVSMVAGEQIIGKGTSSMTIKADVDLKTPLITTGNGANIRIDAADHPFVIHRLVTDTPFVAAGIGGHLSISADSIRDQSAILLPAGILDLNATHRLLIDNALIDVSAVSMSFQGEIKTAPGGKVILGSDQADVELTKTARIDLSAVTEGGDAGSLTVNTPQGEFIWQGTVSAIASKGKGGHFELNEQNMSGTFSILNSQLAGAGFDEAVSLRLGQGDITLAQADTLRAHEVTLTADTGNINVAGVIDARGNDGGRVELFAGDNVNLGGRIDAHATTDKGNGGTVKLTTLDSDQDGIGEIDVSGEINVAGGSRGKDGTVWYRARRLDSNNNGQNDEVAIVHAGTVTGAAVVNYVPVRVYDGVNIVNRRWLSQWQNDNQAYMAFSDAIASRLNANGHNHGRVLPGSLVRSDGDMTISTNIDFSGWRYGKHKTPGEIIFSAKDNLRINQDISDGFKDTRPMGLIVNDTLMTGKSWSYDFIAGADRQSANFMDANKGRGNIILVDNTKIRTGTGSIDISSGNDLILSNPASVIYTAGQVASDGGGFSLFNRVMLDIPYTEYPHDGGDIRIRTGGNIKGAVSQQSIRSWLRSTGNWSRKDIHKGELPTSWGLGLSDIKFYENGVIPTPAFQRGIGALGGGHIDIRVAGNMQDVSVVIPTSGRPLDKSRSSNPAVLDFATNRLEISGGGSMNINVGGNINGGMFYLGRGEGTLRTEGGLLKGANNRYPVFAMGDTRFNVVSRKDLGIGAVFDPLVETPQSGKHYFFFSYSAASVLSLTSVAGDIRFASGGYYKNNDGYHDNGRKYYQTIYPASLSASSLTGDLILDKGFTLFPSATGQLELLAANSIMTSSDALQNNKGRGATVLMSDTDPALLPNAAFPLIWNSAEGKSIETVLYQRFASDSVASLLHASTPLHTADDKSVRMVAERGTIAHMQMDVPKKAVIYAGRDIRNSSFSIQNIADEDHSRITAGRDFRNVISRDYTGAIKGGGGEVKVSGPGQLILQAGRNINLGASTGILSVGNTRNPALANKGADIILIAGVKDHADYAGFAKTYISQSDKYIAALRTFINDGVIDFDTNGATVSSAQADSMRKTFTRLSQQKQQNFLRELFFRELRDVGVRNAKAGSNFYQPAYDAIASLFPGHYAGNITLFLSQIATLDGGNIQLLVPGGGVNAGLASSAGFSKNPDQLGVIVQREGKIEAFVRDDFAVNVSRVFTMAGGDIMLFASKGNINAGRGAKSSLAAPAPTITYDAKGNLKVEYPPAVKGSGIRTFASGDIKAGNVYLFAPQGKIDAGDAGIGGKDIVLGAPTIIGSNNIDIGGVSVGVPTTSVGLAAGLTGVSNLSASSNKVAEESTSSIGKISENAGFSSTPMGFLNVELVGFGGGVTTISNETKNQ